jgi:HSP20 family protein
MEFALSEVVVMGHHQGVGIMQLMRFEPLREMENLSARLNRVFANQWPLETPADGSAFGDWMPAMDIEENDKEYLVKADLPAIKRDDVKVGIVDGILTVEGERKQEKEEKGKRFHRVERSFGRFVRRVAVPTDVDEKKVSAVFADGVLNGHLPQSENAKPRSVEVKVL